MPDRDKLLFTDDLIERYYDKKTHAQHNLPVAHHDKTRSQDIYSPISLSLPRVQREGERISMQKKMEGRRVALSQGT